MNSTRLAKLNPCPVDEFYKNKISLFNQISIYVTLVVRQENKIYLKREHIYIRKIGNKMTNIVEFDLIRNGWYRYNVNCERGKN